MRKKSFFSSWLLMILDILVIVACVVFFFVRAMRAGRDHSSQQEGDNNVQITQTVELSAVATAVKTDFFTAAPTVRITAVPTAAPTIAPTAIPTAVPTVVPTAIPTAVPTVVPTAIPTAVPTVVPTAIPTPVPTAVPKAVPTAVPTAIPTAVPTVPPTARPTAALTAKPTAAPTATSNRQPVSAMTNAKAGDVVTFGRYPQTSTADIMPIQWLVLDRDGDYLLMISYYCLDVVRYHNTNQAVTWETCDLRKWLNNDFYNFAFTSEEKAFIARARLINEDSANASGGSSTYDNVFLLSANEAASLFSSDEARSAQPTGFAKALGAYTSKAGNVWWWLRTPGRAQNYAAGVYGRGEIDTDGEIVDLSKYDKIVDAVRPVIFVNVAP